MAENMNDNAKYIYSFFKNKGWTSNSICGMLGNMQGESGIIADKNEAGGGGGYGLVQWTPKSVLTNWASQNGLDYKTVDTQCRRIQWELENGQQFYATSAYPMNFKQFTQSTSTPTYLAAVFINNYERPANSNQPQRGVWAEQWYSTLVTGTTPPSSGNSNVQAGQVQANKFAGCNIDTDGVRGAETKKAGIKVLQHAMNLDYNAGLAVDGVWGTASSNALGSHYVKSGETQYMVTAAEILVMLRGYNPNGVEYPGTFGSGLKTAITSFQSANGLSADGICGRDTFISLIS
ncbi:Peptidoglycan-binding domain 1 protein [Clostridium sp. DL-VIII]|uniref:phage tail tip lysozyme n=1 Tax=Clostridium sp. DL-VIII TaxID=641107 RepID=UPI00023AFF42|nr:phage tail tip lysozyme [Clostridium sp. DL-VIII]EHJ00328.1 Peptidoglycan-binding domain 1 protein [Clostridium sp. DL-VIII]